MPGPIRRWLQGGRGSSHPPTSCRLRRSARAASSAARRHWSRHGRSRGVARPYGPCSSSAFLSSRPWRLDSRGKCVANRPEVRLTKRKRSLLRRFTGTVALACLLWLALSLGVVLVLRVVDPPTTAVMLLQPGPASELEYTWVDRDAIASSAARAVMAA